MADLHSPLTPLTVHLPADLIAELQQLAEERKLSLDDVVREACIAYSEPHVWERCYRESVDRNLDPSLGQNPPLPGAKSA